MHHSVLEVTGLKKAYGSFRAVDDLSFEVNQGEIFGLLGPNGAGKTTTIRIIMDIFRADSGEVRILDQAPSQVREEIGYLPEERGLYRDLKVMESLIFLGQLKGLTRDEARQNSTLWLERVGLSDWAQKKSKELSRGMQQKLQFAASVVHNPEIMILDEPFQGLDPVNVELLKRLIRELQEEGRTVVLSAHQMNLVEELCDRILLINRGRAVLYGELEKIKRDYAPNTVRIRTSTSMDEVAHSVLNGVEILEERRNGALLSLNGTSPDVLLESLVRAGVGIELFEIASMPLNDIFVQAVSSVPAAHEETV